MTAAPLWTLYIEPFIRRLGPQRVMQIGVGDGEASLRLLAYCRESGCRADIVEPQPAPGLEEALGAFAEEHAFFRAAPLKALPLAGRPDVVTIDGEPNWWTVFTLLDRLRRLAAEAGQPFPFVFVRHTCGPYARRDQYRRPDAVEEKHPFAYQGVDPDRPELAEDGLNARFAHALHEGGPRNGVLTAVEDFVANAPFEVGFRSLPVFDGLGLLAPRARMTPELEALIEGFFSPDGLVSAAAAVEREALSLRVRLETAESRLARRTHALARARELLERQDATISALNRQLAAGRKPAPGEAAEAELGAIIRRLPERPKGWKQVLAAVRAMGEPEAKAEVWISCLALWNSLAGNAAEGFGAELAGRLFGFLANAVELLAPPDPAGIEGAWRLVGTLYADPAFGALAARYPEAFAEFLRVSAYDSYLKAPGHGADLSPCVPDALARFAPEPHRKALVETCRAAMAQAQGGLPHVAATAERLLADPEFHRPVIVCGFHHSGTRLLARQLAALGVAQRINQFQYEWTYVIQLNSILEPGCLDPGRLGSGREDAGIISPEQLAFRMALAGLGPGQPWGFKDPRNGLTARAWLKAFPHARVVNLMRDPAATLGTLPEAYDRFVRLDERRPTRTRFWIELWEAYVQGARAAAAAAEASVEIRFEDLCADPIGVLRTVQAGLGLGPQATPAMLADIPIEAGKRDMRGRLRAQGALPAAELDELEAFGDRYGYPRG